MQAIILAAGMGKRLKALTQDVTKCIAFVAGCLQSLSRGYTARHARAGAGTHG